MFTDTHCHLDFEDFDSDREEVIARAKAAGIAFLVNPAVDLPSAAQAQSLANAQAGFVYFMAGVHPNYANGFNAASPDALRAFAHDPLMVAIGEIGLDYYRDYTAPALQREVFQQQLTLAAELELPVVVHNREADEDVLGILLDWQRGLDTASRIKHRPGVLHAYGAAPSSALALLEAHYYFGIGGPLTYKNAADRREVVNVLPLESMLLETDAPFLTPQPHRGRRNEPAYIPLVAAEIARIKGMPVEEVGKVTTRSACQLFNIPQQD